MSNVVSRRRSSRMILFTLLGALSVLLNGGCGNPGVAFPPGTIPIGGGTGGGGGINPIGIFLNRFTGPIGGAEFLQILATSQSNVYLVSTLDGQGVITRIDTNGDMTIQETIDGIGTATGVGKFSDTRNFVLEPILTLPGLFTDAQFVYRDNRIIGTSTDFPLEGSASASNNNVVGDYDTVVTPVNPETGQALAGGATETINLSLVNNSGLRVTRPGGEIYDGIFLTPTRVAFRVVLGATGRFASFSGSANNIGQDMVGVMDFDTAGDMAATLLLQTRDTRGGQTQSQFSFQGTPVNNGGPVGPTSNVEVVNQTLSDIAFQLFTSTDSNAGATTLTDSGSLAREGTLFGSGNSRSSFNVSCDAGSMVLVINEILISGNIFVSDVVRQPDDYECGDSIQFIVTGASGTPLTITDLVFPNF